MKFLAVIPARGGSKGVKNKNLQKVGNESLLQRAINCSIQYMDVIVSTDSEKIKSEALENGAKVPFLRPKELASDTAKSIDTCIHAVLEYERIYTKSLDYIFLIEPTSPFRNSEHIKKTIDKLRTDEYNTIVSICQLENKPENIFLKGEYLRKYIEIPNEKFEQRQLMKNLCRINSAIYATDRNSLLNKKKFIIDPIGFIEMSLIESINIDTLLDLKYANFISNELCL
tara:strand:- start:71 stop:754 length:684 start_codon:yes stop_codon:yes gene_type:complete